mmetsp:Transcript_33623/g.52313  ORF Transcript_33623/g.52313 Transcript_33623/m.52313 type:complete len:262 (+) Transcript_33623:393-1178(+)|eukprot:CAMPEP_0184294034 /NCGR_PEP_ID=MMETSP1049-20130417/5326_1 /TAXON_ID=77928 /ORGANISM="Proteomonas sulcata, Strain CCMP704" /LENGTH=261 /DNA_ID=CAMNT_0026602193 /DNA_START=158 /DNA_END=943 /DNA_ORIENTATION=-
MKRLGPLTGLSISSYKPWLDEKDSENVFYASMHLVAKDFYPFMAKDDYYNGCGYPDFESKTTGQKNDPNYPNILNIPLSKTSSKEECSAQFKASVEGKLIPKLVCFEPDVIFLSAGFDGHWEDEKGNRGMSHLVEEDYEWITRRLMDIADQSCKGRIISVLEGGYHTERPAGQCGKRKRAPAVNSGETEPGALATCVCAHIKSLLTAHSEEGKDNPTTVEGHPAKKDNRLQNTEFADGMPKCTKRPKYNLCDSDSDSESVG